MKKTLEVINGLEKEGTIKGYAIGGATALLFYAEPALTFDVDIFVFLPGDTGGSKAIFDQKLLKEILQRHSLDKKWEKYIETRQEDN